MNDMQGISDRVCSCIEVISPDLFMPSVPYALQLGLNHTMMKLRGPLRWSGNPAVEVFSEFLSVADAISSHDSLNKECLRG